MRRDQAERRAGQGRTENPGVGSMKTIKHDRLRAARSGALERCHAGAIRGRIPCTWWTNSYTEVSEFSAGEFLECFRVRFGRRLLISGSKVRVLGSDVERGKARLAARQIVFGVPGRSRRGARQGYSPPATLGGTVSRRRSSSTSAS